jgi:hypothetical protein
MQHDRRTLSRIDLEARWERWRFVGNALVCAGPILGIVWSWLGIRGTVRQIIAYLLPHGLGWMVILPPLMALGMMILGILLMKLSKSRLHALRHPPGVRLCINCRYVLEGLKAPGTCPECGQIFGDS